MKLPGLIALSTARPQLRVGQDAALGFVLDSFPMRPATRQLYERLFRHPGVKERRFALESLHEVLETDPDVVNRRFEKRAVALAARALRSALKQAKVRPGELDYLAVCTCTGYLCPGIAPRLVEACGLRRDIRFIDAAGMGCGGAIPALEQACNFLAAHPRGLAACVAVEVCSAAMVHGDSADLVVSNALFADGAAACVLSSGRGKPLAQLKGFASKTFPEWREDLRFVSERGRLRNVLSREVPDRSARALAAVVSSLMSREGIIKESVERWVIHPGGPRVLDAAREALGLSEPDLRASRKSLKNNGNLSSASVLFVLKELLDSSWRPRPGERGVMASFGAGFSAHAALLQF